MTYEFFCLTDTGRLRESNEDAVVLDPDNRVAVLADGMGGYNAGEVASAMATTHIKAELGRWLSEGGAKTNARDIQRAMETSAENANHAIFNAAQTNPSYDGMGTTLVMGVFQEARAFIGHIGDSRCYRLRAGQLVLLTRDHSLLQEQIDAGLISLEQAQYAPHKNLVTRALGVADSALLEVNEYPAKAGDLYLMCSDGLNDMVPDDQIASLLATAGSLETKAHALVNAANDSGGRDNISVVLVYAQTKAVRRGLLARMLHP
jgi:PPM family protein phosphatase